MYPTDHELTELFYQVVRDINHLAKAGPPSENPFSGQYKCLFLLDKAESIPQKKLAEILEIRSTSLSELLGKLEKKGYISRRPSETDKRTYSISITPEGSREVQRVRSLRLKEHHELTEPLSQNDKKQLYELLLKIKNYYRLNDVTHNRQNITGKEKTTNINGRKNKCRQN